MSAAQQQLGRLAEDATARWLATRGWCVLERRWRSPSGEIDLVCRDPDGVLVGVEVKLRRTSRAGGAADAVDARRLARLRGALVDYARQPASRATGLRIDLVSVTPAGTAWRLERTPGVDGW
jgi:putative endonuclease